MNFDCDPNLSVEIIFISNHYFLTRCFHMFVFKNKTKLHLVSRYYFKRNGQKFSLENANILSSLFCSQVL